MNNLHVLSRTQHPHLFTQNQIEQKPNRIKIQLTQTQGFPIQLEKSNISTMPPIQYSKCNQNKEEYLIKEITFPSQEPKQINELNINLYKLMKEQLDIAVSGYRQKTNKILKDQAEKIQKLSAIITHGNKVIQKQSEVIANLKNNKEYLINSTYTRVMGAENRSISKSPKKISLTHKNTFKNMPNVRDTSPLKGQQRETEQLQCKINKLKITIEQIQKRSHQSFCQSRDLLKKVSDFEKIQQKQIWNRIKIGEQSLQRFIIGNEKKIINIQKTVESCLNFKKQMTKKMMLLEEEQKQLKEIIFNLQQREYVYDSYQLNVLKDQLNYMSQIVNTIIVSNNPEAIMKKSVPIAKQSPPLKQGDPMNYSQHVIVKRKNNFDSQFVELQRSQYSSLSHYAPKYVKGVQDERVRRSQEWDDLQQNNSALSDEDQFYYDNNMLTEEYMTSDRASKLEEVMRNKGYRFPVQIQVDQTGYMKVHKTGMYILDQNDNGFELCQVELQSLRRRGVIHF